MLVDFIYSEFGSIHVKFGSNFFMTHGCVNTTFKSTNVSRLIIGKNMVTQLFCLWNYCDIPSLLRKEYFEIPQ